MAAQLEDHLYLMEIDEALGQIRSQTGLDQFEMIGMDARTKLPLLAATL